MTEFKKQCLIGQIGIITCSCGLNMLYPCDPTESTDFICPRCGATLLKFDKQTNNSTLYAGALSALNPCTMSESSAIGEILIENFSLEGKELAVRALMYPDKKDVMRAKKELLRRINKAVFEKEIDGEPWLKKAEQK